MAAVLVSEGFVLLLELCASSALAAHQQATYYDASSCKDCCAYAHPYQPFLHHLILHNLQQVLCLP